METHERKTRRAPLSPSLPGAPLLSFASCLLGSYFVLLYATFLIDCCSVAICVATVWRLSKDPRKNTVCLLPPPHVWSVCPHGAESDFTCTILFLFAVANSLPHPWAAGRCRPVVRTLPTPHTFDGFVPLLPSTHLFFPQKSLFIIFSALTTSFRFAPCTAAKWVACFLFQIPGPRKERNWTNRVDTVYESPYTSLAKTSSL